SRNWRPRVKTPNDGRMMPSSGRMMPSSGRMMPSSGQHAWRNSAARRGVVRPARKNYKNWKVWNHSPCRLLLEVSFVPAPIGNPGDPMPPLVFYPESDGQPIADNTKQFSWIVLIYCNLTSLFHRRADVFVAGNLFWYPVEGRPELRVTPDVLVVFNRPRG